MTLPLGAVLKAWCGHLLPIITVQHDHLPGGTDLTRNFRPAQCRP